jgi:3-methyladenine DNA glycosylase AlkC
MAWNAITGEKSAFAVTISKSSEKYEKIRTKSRKCCEIALGQLPKANSVRTLKDSTFQAYRRKVLT